MDKEFSISTDKNLLDINLIHNFLSNESYWAKGISKERIKKVIENSFCFGIYKDNKQIGFARVVSDLSSFAYLADVFVLKDYRGKGLASLLIKTILGYDNFKSIRRWLLATKDAHEIYKKLGFKSLENPEKFMEIFNPDAYIE